MCDAINKWKMKKHQWNLEQSNEKNCKYLHIRYFWKIKKRRIYKKNVDQKYINGRSNVSCHKYNWLHPNILVTPGWVDLVGQGFWLHPFSSEPGFCLHGPSRKSLHVYKEHFLPFVKLVWTFEPSILCLFACTSLKVSHCESVMSCFKVRLISI
jgi:hypothetical protein